MNKIKISNEDFALICFIVLMQNGDGLIDKSLDYIQEKQSMIKEGLNAFGALDIYNMRKVKEWCDTWNIEMPKEPSQYLNESEDAFAELKGKGFNF